LTRANGSDPPPSLDGRYTRFDATTEQSAPLRRIGTFGLAVGAACACFRRASFQDRNLLATSHTGLVNNLNFGLSWGMFPLFFARLGLTVGRIGIPTSIYPGVCSGSLRRRKVCDRVSRRSHKAISFAVAVRVSGALFRAWLRIGAGASGIRHERGRREAGLAPEGRRVAQGGARPPAWTMSQPWPATTQKAGPY